MSLREAMMLGAGVYTVAEVARLTELNPNRVRSWFKPRPDGAGLGPIFESDYEPVDGDYAVSFLDLIDVLIVGLFRGQFQVPMRVVRRTHALLQEQLQTEHPFCMSDLYTDGRRIFRCVADALNEDVLTEVISRQQFFPHVRRRLHHIDYNEITRLAKRWRIGEGVVVEPSVCMGKPTIADTGIATYVISNQYYANSEDPSLIADLYGISEDEVVSAVMFEGRYRHRSAA